MTVVLALVGRPNVGKSTLFNRLTRSRDALVADLPGLTRDRQYGFGRLGSYPFMVIDTGGLTGEEEVMDQAMAQQTWRAIEESDLVLFLVDAQAGITGHDQMITEDLRSRGIPVLLVVNKVDGHDPDVIAAEFHALGLGKPQPIAAAQGRGLTALLDRIGQQVFTVTQPMVLHPDSSAVVVPGSELAQLEEDVVPSPSTITNWPGIRVAVVGRPNVGKSTLINRLLGHERVLATPVAGTTRDSIFIPLSRGGKEYTLIDTAGIRRRARVHDAVEKFSIVKTLRAIDVAQVVLMLLDAQDGITEQDAHLLGLVLDAGRALVLVLNKWDGLDQDIREQVLSDLERRLGFLNFARIRRISALHGTNVGHLLEDVAEAHASAFVELPTSRLTRWLEEAVHAHPPPRGGAGRIKLRFAHQGGKNPPIIVIHGNQTDQLPTHYKRYLENFFRTQASLVGTPLKLEFRSSTNPYAGRKNVLTPRQERKRKRLLRHVRKR